MAIIRTHFPEVNGQAGRIIEKQLIDSALEQTTGLSGPARIGHFSYC